MDPIIRSTALALARRIRQREVSPVEVVTAHIHRIEQVNRQINAVVADRFERALDEARAAEAELARSCTIKDFYSVEGLPNTGGVWMRRNEVATRDAEVVRRLRRAGAIVLGVTNVPEGGLWLESDNPIYGRCNNPWDLRRTSGGSSGGEGAIVAAGGSPFGMGSDIGGSIRLPAAFCGVAGHKPTGRMVPLTGHWPPLTGEHRAYLTSGPLARSVDDLAAVLRIVAGPESEADFVQPWELGDPAEIDLRGVTVHPVEDSTVPASPALKKAVSSAARVLASRGARLEPLRGGLFKEAIWIWGAMMASEGGTSYAELVSGNPRLSVVRELTKRPLGRSHHTLPVLGAIALERVFRRMPGRGNEKLAARGRALVRELTDTLGDRGVLLHPPYSRSAPLHGRPLLRPFDVGFTALFNVLELPATQVPTGLDDEGLPLGVQVIGARGRDHLCLAVARAIEEELGTLTPVNPRPRSRPESARV
jgi:fatty acid amide hydrolase 2